MSDEQSPPKPRIGRRPKVVDPKVVEGMASVGATNAEIGDFCGVSSDTIARRFARELAKARANLKTRLRTAQVKLALGGNATMLIWLGKQMLEQADQQRIRVGNLEDLSDADLKALAEGKLPS